MRVTEKNHRLIIKSAERFFETLFLLCLLSCGAYALYQYFHYPFAWHRESFQGCIGGASTGLLGFLAVYERAIFEFDQSGRTLRWRRRRIFGSKAGLISFDAITLVSVKSALGSNRVNPSVRIAVHTQTEEIPLTAAYSPDPSNECEKLAERIRTFIGRNSPDSFMDIVRDSVQKGNKTEAIRLLCLERGFNLTEAKQFIDKEILNKK